MNKQLFPTGFNPLACPNCKSETFEISMKYWETCNFNSGNNGDIWFETMDRYLDDSYDSNLHCVECGEIVDVSKSYKSKRVMLMKDELNIYPIEADLSRIEKTLKINADDIISVI